MASSAIHLLIRLLAFLYAILGLLLFFAPEWSSVNFSWKISPWVAMTIGGWCLGNAFIAGTIARVRHWSAVYTSTVYMWSFGILQSIVLIIFRDRLLLNGPLAWIYITALAVNVLFAVISMVKWTRQRPHITVEGGPMFPIARTFTILGLTIVGLIAAGVFVKIDQFTSGKALPEPMSLFTISAFGMFYTSLVLAGLTLIPKKGALPLLLFARGGVALTIPITIAALVYFHSADFNRYPGVLLYIIAYIIVLIAVGAVEYSYRRR